MTEEMTLIEPAVEAQKQTSRYAHLFEIDPALRREIQRKGIDLIIAEHGYAESRLHLKGKKLVHELRLIGGDQLENRIQEKLTHYNTFLSMAAQSGQFVSSAVSLGIGKGTLRGGVFDLAAQAFGGLHTQAEQKNQSGIISKDHSYQTLSALNQDHREELRTQDRGWQGAYDLLDRTHQSWQRVFEMLCSSTS